MATSPQRIGFFGPFGTYTEQALLTQADLASAELVPYRNVPDVLDAVENGSVDAGFVPIENSIEGTVNFTQDALIFDYELLIQREVVLDIEHCIVAPKATTLSDVSVILSIPVATAQCSAYLRTNLSSVEIHAANSTADAARLVGERSAAGEKGLAAIAPRNAAKLYGLDVIAGDIADHAGNQTRFVLVGRNDVPVATGHDKTESLFFSAQMNPEA